MSHTDPDAGVAHVPHVSIRDQLTSAARRKEIPPDLNFAESNNIATVTLAPGGQRVPAATGLRTTLTGVVPTATRTTYQWHVTLTPLTDGMLRRLFAERNDTIMAVEDAPLPGWASARYDAVGAIDAAHKPLCALRQGHIGTHLQMVFAVCKDLTRVVSYDSSETAAIRRTSKKATGLNDLRRRKYAREEELWSAKHIFFLGRQFWPIFKTIPRPDLPTLRPVPVIPAEDRWVQGGEMFSELGDVVARDFAPVLESLWKATFAQDDHIRAQLVAAGYQLDRLEATRMGFQPLRELMQGFRNDAHMTMLGGMDLLDDLSDEHIANMTVGTD